ncbi:hypothetical protein J1605_016959 [Eschrichtius robustus]|uniref:Uncharacterized protein n=1 Tax=Eschrichtius robustus TaxID=9764 RepID=A0AB34HZY5_ESCRO|nr:hypothetical protein J1605_016959 [Eschrichtius robustus]
MRAQVWPLVQEVVLPGSVGPLTSLLWDPETKTTQPHSEVSTGRSSRGERGLLFVAVQGLLIAVSEFNPLTFTSVIECEKPNNDLTRFRGCM